jgi:hypothetical protein
MPAEAPTQNEEHATETLNPERTSGIAEDIVQPVQTSGAASPTSSATPGNPAEKAEVQAELNAGEAGESIEGGDTEVALPEVSQKKSRKPPKPAKGNSPPGVHPCTSTEVSPSSALGSGRTISKAAQMKLIIFNVHGTLLDCSLLASANENPKIRSSIKTACRRVVFKPWLKPFLHRCFGSFLVAFWGTKSRPYMDDLVPTMVADFKGIHGTPLFIKSARDCSWQESADGSKNELVKNLAEVYTGWPSFNATNTVLVDSKPGSVANNPIANNIMITLFFVKNISSLSDDKEYLKRYLWPALEAFKDCPNVVAFRLQFPKIGNESLDQMIQKRQTGHAYEFLDVVEGEGISIPQGCTSHSIPSPSLELPI